MGKGLIKSGGKDGLYTVDLDYGEATRAKRLAALDALLLSLSTQITSGDVAAIAHKAQETALANALTAATTAYIAAARALPLVPATLANALAAYNAVYTALNKMRSDHAPARLALAALRAQWAQASRDRSYWAGLPLVVTQPAWCVDYTEDATGSVATIELPGENKLVLIAPSAPAPTAADGIATAREVQAPGQVFWNAAVLPGWQKFKPTFRRGIVTAVDTAADTVNVTLIDDLSSAQGLGINQTPTLTKVPVVYMSCHAAVFEVDDRCVVEFLGQDWTRPMVIGFVDNPKPCATWRVLSGVVRNGRRIEGAGVWRLFDYRPTANAWQKPLKSDPAKASWHGEELLAPNDGGVVAVGSAYSGLMSKLVQLLSGYGKLLYPTPGGADGIDVVYQSWFATTHGIIKDPAGKPWLVEISAARGVLAMRLPTFASRKPGAGSLAAKELGLLFGAEVPSGGTFPEGAALSAAIGAGTVYQLISAVDMAAVYGTYSAYNAASGWSFDMSGTQAHNTCWRAGAGAELFVRYGAHFSVSFSWAGTVPAAMLVQVSEAPMLGAAVRCVSTWNPHGEAPPGTAAGDVLGPATVFVCHRGDTLVKVTSEWRVNTGAQQALNDYYDGLFAATGTYPPASFVNHADSYHLVTVVGVSPGVPMEASAATYSRYLLPDFESWVEHYTDACSNAVVFCHPTDRDSFTVQGSYHASSWGVDASVYPTGFNGAYGHIDVAANTADDVAYAVVTPEQVINFADAPDAGFLAYPPTYTSPIRVGAIADVVPVRSTVGTDPHLIYSRKPWNNASAGLTLEGALFAGETTPVPSGTDNYYFVGLL